MFDCYRPTRAVRHFLRWADDPNDPGRPEYQPGLEKRDLFRLGYLARRSGHSRGSTVDLTLVRLADRSELDMGTFYDFAGPRAWLTDRSVGAEARANRALLVEAMGRRGFKPFVKEWWHFTLQGEPFPDRYFDFPVRVRALQKSENPSFQVAGVFGRPEGRQSRDVASDAGV